MSTWLDPVRRALDARPLTVRLFVRDDDAGWDDDGLRDLLDVCGRHGLPIDLAVIPSEVTAARAAWLLRQQWHYPARLGLHQHGWAHTNHEPAGRKCEFGPSRPAPELRDDVARGQRVLHDALGPCVDAVFTPPWNRCAPALGPMLADLGFEVLSRDVSAAPLDTPGLRECPVHVDWSARRSGALRTPDELAAACADALAAHSTLGLLFHHAVMSDDDRARAGALLEVLAAHPRVEPVSLLEASRTAAATPAAALEVRA